MRIWKSWISFAKQLRPCRNTPSPTFPLEVTVTVEKTSDEPPIYISFDVPCIGSAKGRNDSTKDRSLLTLHAGIRCSYPSNDRQPFRESLSVDEPRWS